MEEKKKNLGSHFDQPHDEKSKFIPGVKVHKRLSKNGIYTKSIFPLDAGTTFFQLLLALVTLSDIFDHLVFSSRFIRD
jgi:hypothetical protein